jgi:Ca2+/Na+ antiporter
MGKNKMKAFLPVLFVFVIFNSFLFSAKNMQQRWNLDQDVGIIGNTLLFVLTLVSFLLARRGLNNANPYAFVRSIYVSVMIKLFVCIIAAFIYISMYKTKLNKPALFLCMGLYLVYTFLEVAGLTRLLKQKKNG